MILEKKHLENVVILFVEGYIKLGDSAEFFHQAAQKIEGNLIIDFTKVDLVDSTGVGELVGFCGRLDTKNPRPVFVNSSCRIDRLFKIGGLNKFRVYPDLKEALAAL